MPLNQADWNAINAHIGALFVEYTKALTPALLSAFEAYHQKIQTVAQAIVSAMPAEQRVEAARLLKEMQASDDDRAQISAKIDELLKQLVAKQPPEEEGQSL